MGIIEYFKETKAEMSHVTWPTKKQTLVYTLVVVLISVVIAVYLGFFDSIFSKFVEFLITNK